MAGVVPDGTIFNDIREKVKKRHVESALEYLIKHNVKTEKGVLYDIDGKYQPKTSVLQGKGHFKGYSFGMQAIVRVAYLYSRGVSTIEDEDLIKVNNIRNNSNKNSSRWSWMSAKALLKVIGFSNDEADDKNITLDDIKREHVEKALDYILEGNKEKSGVYYVIRPAPKNRIEFAGKEFGVRETFRLTFLCCAGIDLKSINRSKFHDKFHEVREEFGPSKRIRMSSMKRVLKNLDIKVEDDAHDLLMQFYQIIFYGPPGTGKTYAAMDTIAEIFKADGEKLRSLQGKRWDIVQFHPSYNYEDFVRGVKVKTTEKKNVEYITEDRVFGKMCRRAMEDSDNKYALIIDEINRANVSAVLGELIYALEYRGKEIKTPYNIGGDKGDMLVIPKNLYIIGTMNTADRTIGQIDYAVRRRFAFEYCPPEREVIEEHIKNPEILHKILHIYDDIEKLFKTSKEKDEQKYLSQDYDAKDVRIGHSYFLHDAERKDISPNKQIARKIIYQVIPVLREYVKDGILSGSAEEKINEIEKGAKGLSGDGAKNENDDSGNERENTSPKNRRFFWKKGGRRSDIMVMGRIVLSIVKDYVEQNPSITIDELKKWFPDKAGDKNVGHGIKLETDSFTKDRFYTNEEDRLNIGGEVAYVTNQWGYGGNWKSGTAGSFADFREDIKKSGYLIRNENELEEENEEREQSSKRRRLFWKKGERRSDTMSIRRIVLSIVQDYVKNTPDITIEKLKEWFPDKLKKQRNRGIKLEREIKDRDRFFMKEGEGIKIGGEYAYVTSQWGYAPGYHGSFENFEKDIEKSGYIIHDENKLEEE